MYIFAKKNTMKKPKLTDPYEMKRGCDTKVQLLSHITINQKAKLQRVADHLCMPKDEVTRRLIDNMPDVGEL